MLTLNEYDEYVRFKKTVDDALFDQADNQTGLIFQMSAQQLIVPKFLTDQNNAITTAQLKWLDDMLIERYGRKWLNRAGGNLFTFDHLHNHLNPVNVSDLKRVINNILLNYINKWNYEWDAIWADYNPIHNYNMYQKEGYHSRFKDTMAGEKYHDQIIDETHNPASVDITKVTKKNFIPGSGGADPTPYKETITYDRHYTDVQSPKVDNADANYEEVFDQTITTDETVIAGYDSTEGTIGGGSSSNTGYNQKEKIIHKAELADSSTPTTKKITASHIRHDDVKDGDKESTESKQLEGGTEDEMTLTVTNGSIRTNPSTGDDGRPGNREIESVSDGYYTQNEHMGYDDLERTGNIGVTTSQQMIESELKLRNMYNFIDILLRDIADYISLKIY